MKMLRINALKICSMVYEQKKINTTIFTLSRQYLDKNKNEK